MRRLQLLVGLMVSTSSAWAEWTEIGETNDGMTIYVDYATIRRSRVRVLVSLDSHIATETC